MKATRFFVLILVLVLLVTLSGAAGAQEPQPSGGEGVSASTLLNDGCGSGSSYDPACDVDHDSDTDIIDVQLVASHWGQTGTWTSDGWSLTGNPGTNPLTHFLGTTDPQPLVIKTNNAEAMRVAANGNVGIGTDNPQGRLDVRGGDLLVDSSTGNLRIRNAFWGDGWRVVTYGGGEDLSFQSVPATGGVDDRLTIRQGGNVGIGTTLPQDVLHLFRWAPSTVGVLMGNSFTGEGRRGFLVDYHFSNGAELWNFENTDMWFGTNNSRRMTIRNNGNVGIGTSNPASFAKLHVVGGRIFGESGVLGWSTVTNTMAVSGRNFGSGGLPDLDTFDIGVHGASNSGIGVDGATFEGIGVRGRSSGGGLAGQFIGNVNVTGTLTKGGGAFRIDHPLDPSNKYLYHSFVESPDMMNIYNGNAMLDANGEAWVELPEWFEILNRDFRYQLTCIGGFAPVYIAEEIQNNRFKIAGGSPGMKVSWQVTGIRQDSYANAHRIPVEEEKPEAERGYYIHPELHGQPKEMSIEGLYLHRGQEEHNRGSTARYPDR